MNNRRPVRNQRDAIISRGLTVFSLFGIASQAEVHMSGPIIEESQAEVNAKNRADQKRMQQQQPTRTKQDHQQPLSEMHFGMRHR